MQDIQPIVKDWLESPGSGDWILVVDNTDDKDDFFPEEDRTSGLAQFIPRGGKGTIVVTTKDFGLVDQPADYNTIRKDMMEAVQAVQLFTRHFPKATYHEQEPILQLLGALQHLPLAIVQVAAHLRKNTACSLADYIELFNSTRQCQTRLSSQPDLWREASIETVLATLSITFQQVQEQSPLSGSLLKLIACINRQNIPHELLALIGLEGADDEITLREAISELLNFSLLTTVEHGSAYETHSLVHFLMAAFLKKEQEVDTVLVHAAQSFVKVLPDGSFENWALWRIYFPHASAFLSNIAVDSVDTAEIYFRMSRYLLLVGRYTEAEVLARRSTQVRAYFLGQEHPSTLASMANLVSAYWNQGRWGEAEELNLKVRETRVRVLRLEHSDTLASMPDLASTHWTQRRLEEAEELEVEVMKARKRVLGQECLDTLTSMANLASTYRNQGRWMEAEKLEVKFMETSLRVPGQEYPDALATMSDLASAYGVQGWWKKAEELDLKVTEANLRALGQEHPGTLTSMSNLALTYWNQGRWKEAKDWTRSVRGQLWTQADCGS